MITSEIKKELSSLGISPKKSLGQNFLIREAIYEKIISAVEPASEDNIIEIGPGLGTLTQYLAKSGAKIIAVEKDRDLIGHLTSKLIKSKNVTIIEGDILKFKVEDLNLEPTKYKVVGNIPYYITSHLLRRILEKWPKPKSITLLVQKEVAKRIVAKPPNMSMLGVSVQYYSSPKIISYVSKSNFLPQPKVDSAIIKLEPRVNNQESRINSEKFFKTARAGFAEKRKQLINNLSAGLKLSKKSVEEKLNLIDIDPKRRAETLTIEEWSIITKALLSQD
ncbi:MAG TPA: 16S rRNA (adenine(1518)-N(6)/adenine(1519)-N(6))-dimethyltransferase RsmA [Candidatus Paceibacterota bacterium]